MLRRSSFRAVFRTFAAALCLLLGACTGYRSTARDVEAPRVVAETGWVRVDGVAVVRQRGEKDCGAAALSAVLAYWGREATPAEIEAATGQPPGRRIRAAALRRYALAQGLQAFVFFGKFTDLEHELARGRPVIVGTGKPLSSKKALAHYEVVVGYHPKRRRVLTVDPAHGLREYPLDGFLAEWELSRRLTFVVFEAAEPLAAR